MDTVLGFAAMSGRHSPHLQRRSGIYHLRLRVPDALKVRVGLVEVRRSLQTYSPERARLLAALYVPRLRIAFKMIEDEKFSRDTARRLIIGCFDDFRTSVDTGYVPTSSEPDLELAEQAALATECIRQAEQSIATRNFPASLLSTAASLCAAQGWSFEELAQDRRYDILEGVARALIEQQKLFTVRLRDRLVRYVPSDPLFPGEINCTPIPSEVARPALYTSPSVSDAVAAYLERGRKSWTAKTHSGRARQLRYLEEHFGHEVPLTAITPADVRAYRDGIKRLRSNHHRTGARSFSSKQTENEAHRISSKTASLMFESVKAFFRWALEEEGYLATNPAEHVRIEAPKTKKGIKSRRPFTGGDLEKLFMQPVFAGCATAKRRFQPGTLRIEDDYFWIPILGYYTGARLGELVQLHIGDVRFDDPIPFLEITEANGGIAGAHNAKHVKSAAGIRNVPLHADVLKLGFEQFVSGRRKNRKTTDRLFYRIPFGSDGQASTVFSKWFARFLDRSGLSDPALVFHSFRHNAQDAFRDALQPTYVIDRIIGHSDGATSTGYGDGISLAVARDAVAAMKLKVRLPELWANINPSQKLF